MAKITGVGGVFFKSKGDGAALAAWYREHLGMALDLSLLVPLYAVAAVLLWRRAAWGYLLATVVLVSGLLHQLSYMVAMPFQAAADVPGAVSFDPGEPVIVLLYRVAATLLFRGAGRTARPWRGR